MDGETSPTRRPDAECRTVPDGRCTFRNCPKALSDGTWHVGTLLSQLLICKEYLDTVHEVYIIEVVPEIQIRHGKLHVDQQGCKMRRESALTK